MAPLFCVDITENRNNDRINGRDTELLEQRREDFREQFQKNSDRLIDALEHLPALWKELSHE